MNTIIIIDDEIFYPVIRYYIAEQQDVMIITSQKALPDFLHSNRNVTTQYCKELASPVLFESIELTPETRIRIN